MDAVLDNPALVGLFAAGLLATGAIAGLLAGLLGVGGGIVIVPVLFHLFATLGIDPSVRMHLAVGTSLAVIIPTSLISARSHHKRGAVDFGLLKSWGPAILVGVCAGTAAATWVEGPVLTGIFAVVALLASLHMGFARQDAIMSDTLPEGAAKFGIGAGIGAFSAMMGIGGGTLSAPILTLFGYPIRQAVGTAAAIGSIIALPGALGFLIGGWREAELPAFSAGFVNLLGVALIAPTTVLTAPWGARLAHTINTRALRAAFAIFLGLTAARMAHGVLT